MTRSHKVLGFLLIAVLGIYGCARGPAGASGDKHAALEAKVQRLEEDFRAAAAARDSFRQKLVAAEEQQGRLQRQLDQDRAATAREREDLQGQVKARTAERDHFQSQYGNFIKTLKEQLEKAETAMNPPASPSTPAVAGTQPGAITTTAAPN
jgi:chromosome segregation ATPase